MGFVESTKDNIKASNNKKVSLFVRTAKDIKIEVSHQWKVGFQQKGRKITPQS